jgi:hypothetical protein
MKQDTANIIYMLKSNLLAAVLTCLEPAVVTMARKVMLTGYAASYSGFEFARCICGK